MRWVLGSALLPFIVAYPDYVGCGLVLPAPGKIPVTYKNGPRTLTCNSTIMGTTLEASENAITLIDVNNTIVQNYVPGDKYTIRLPQINVSGGQSLWDATGGEFTGLGTETCATTRYMSSCAEKDVGWTAPTNLSSVNITYICALPQQARISRSTFGTLGESKHNVCGQGKPTTSTATCRNKNLVGSREQENYMYNVLIFTWVLSIQVHAYTRRQDLQISLEKQALEKGLPPRTKTKTSAWSYVRVATEVVFNGLFFGYSVYNTAEDSDRSVLYWAIVSYLLIELFQLIQTIYGESKIMDVEAIFKDTLIEAAKSVAYFLLSTLLVLSALSSFHHWCNGEQDWNAMTGDWGDFDSWQGTIPWWALAVIWVGYFAFKTAERQLFVLQFVLSSVFVNIVIAAIGGSDAYSDICSWVQIVTVVLLGAAWIGESFTIEMDPLSTDAVSDILNDIGWNRKKYLWFCAIIGVVTLALFGSSAVKGKQVPITMIIVVILACAPILYVCVRKTFNWPFGAAKSKKTAKVQPVKVTPVAATPNQENAPLIRRICPRQLRF